MDPWLKEQERIAQIAKLKETFAEKWQVEDLRYKEQVLEKKINDFQQKLNQLEAMLPPKVNVTISFPWEK